MKKYTILFMLSFITLCSIKAQGWHLDIPKENNNTTKNTTTVAPQKSSFDWSKVSYGGGIGLQFGNYTLINISPQVGYNFSSKFNAGFGLSYIYLKDDFYSGGYKWKESNTYFGMNLYARLYPINNIVLMVQPDISRMWQTVTDNNGYKYKDERVVPAFVVGAGLRLGAMSFMLKYDVVQNDYSPYGNNIFYSVGFNF